MEQQIREFLGRFFRNHDLGYEEDMFSLGYVNSLFAMQLVQFVEQTFGIAVESEDLDIENFRSIGALIRLVERKQGAN